MSKETEYGVCWYKREQGDRFRDMGSDPERIEDTDEEWIQGANKSISRLQSQGMKIRKISVNVEEMLAWCNERGVPLNAESRAEYAARLLADKDGRP